MIPKSGHRFSEKIMLQQEATRSHRAGGRMADVKVGEERRRRLLAVMADSGIDTMLLYGNAWQGDYLRYGADFGMLEGHGIALVSSDGTTELFLDSVVEAERA